MPILSISYHRKVRKAYKPIIHPRCSSAGEIIEQAQSVLKQCEAAPDERHLHIWTILVKALTYARPGVVEQYMPTVND